MISIVLTSASAVASLHTKKHSRRVFSIPLDLDNGGLSGLAQRCRAALRQKRVGGKRIHITLMENVIYKEFTHLPASAKAVAGFAHLEARTVLREQAGNYLINSLSFGEFKNENGEQSSLLLASPSTLMKAIQTAFGSAGFIIDSVHSGFDAFKTACERAIVPVAQNKDFVAIDFSLEHTLVNVYSKGLLASQRRLPGFASALMPFIPAEPNGTDAAKIAKMRSASPVTDLNEEASAALVSFLWDTLRTVRVVSAPLQLDISEFYVSGDACDYSPLRHLIQTNFELPCKFADQADLSAVWCKNGGPSLFVSGGAVFSDTDLLAQIRTAKKNNIFDVAVCITLTAIVLLGFLAQPFAILLKNTTLKAVQTRYESLYNLEIAMQKLTEYSGMLNGISLRKEALKGYKSNVSVTHPEVEALFKAPGLALKSLSYDGNTGIYSVLFSASTKDVFLKLKDDIYANQDYFLNLTLSSNKADKSDEFDCTLTFTPASYDKKSAVTEKTAPQEEPVETDILEDFMNENQ